MTTQCPKCKAENPDTQSFCGDCGTQLAPSKDIPSITKTLETPIHQLTKGTVFANRYEILEKLGKGGMGEVYKVKDKKLDEEMALKVLKPEIAAHEGTIERFKNELKLARRIAHRNVCKMYDLHEEGEIPFITMEYVKGEDLKSLIKRKETLSEKDAIALAKQVCEGLSEAHELGVVHRDLKPQNIMVDEKGIAKVMDFGIARTVEAAGVTQTGVMIGTPDYISPEQAEGEEADYRSDIYSLGVILYEMVTGTVPFKGDTALSVAIKHKSQLPLNPRKMNPDLSDDLNRLILICMEKDRERRYQTAEALLNDLQNIEEGYSLGTKIKPRRATFAGSLIRKKLFIAAIAVALAIAVAIIWKPWTPKEKVHTPEDRPTLAILPFTNNTGDNSLDSWRTILADALEFNLSQSKYLYVIPNGRLLTVIERLNLKDRRNFSSEDLENLKTWGIGNHILNASYFKSGDYFRVNYTLQDVRSNKVLIRDSIEGQGEESFIPMMDEMSKKVKQHLKIEEAEITGLVDKATGIVPTTSLEALRNYNEGTTLFWQFKQEEAAKLFEKALEIDPKMALAYKYLAVIYSGGANVGGIYRYLSKALEYSDQLPERHRLHIQGEYTRLVDMDYEKAKIIYEELLRSYPEDLGGLFAMGAIYRHTGEVEKAIEYGERIVNLYPEIASSVANLHWDYIKIFAFDKARELCEKFVENFPENKIVRNNLLFTYMHSGMYDLALEQIEKFYTGPENINRNHAHKGWIYQMKGNLARAEEEYSSLINEGDYEHKLDGKRYLAHLRLQQGCFLEAKELLETLLEEVRKGENRPYLRVFFDLAYVYLRIDYTDQALKLCDDWFNQGSHYFSKSLALIFKGKTHLVRQSIPEAKTVSDELKRISEAFPIQYYRGWYYYLLGLIASEQGMFDEAIGHFNNSPLKATIMLDNIPCRYLEVIEPLALTYYQKGDIEKAQQEYEKIISLGLLRLGYDDIYVRSHYMLGKIHEDKGDTAKAIENYEKFLDLWKDADPGIAEVEDARNRLAGLKGENP